MVKKDIGNKFERLVNIMKQLRGPNGCPWDKEQTYKDINPYMLEEVHEVMEAIDKNDMEALKEELGDILLHIIFHAQMADEDKNFDIEEVIDGICNKLIYRHPHVFGKKIVGDSKEVVEKWEKLKQLEKNKKSILEGIPTQLPALLKAYRLGEKVGRMGFDWKEIGGVLEKLEEEITELHKAKESESLNEIEKEYGDILFTLANIGRFLKVNPEEALRKSTNRFIKRFKYMEKEVESNKRDLDSLSDKEWNNLWKKAKEHLEN